MKVKDLIYLLEGISPEMDILVYADHGQTGEKATSIKVLKVCLEEGDLIHPDEDDDYPELPYLCVICGG